MQLFLTDETNTQPSEDARFFIYGGLIVPFDNFVELDQGIKEIRLDYGYEPRDKLKFDTRVRPPHVSIEKATEAKTRVIKLALDLECKFIVHIILHDIIKHQDLEEHLHKAANYVIGRFNHYCSEIDDYGICVVDNLPERSQWRYLSDMFTLGLDIQGQRRVKLERILLYAATCINASNVLSAIDIVLGSFRYCVNNPRNLPAAQSMIGQVIKIMWHEFDPETQTYHVGKRGLITRPPLKGVRYQPYRKMYEDLLEHINKLLLASEDTGKE